MQQAAPSAAVQELIAQANSLRHLKKLGIMKTYPTSECEMHRLSVLLFTDPGMHNKRGQPSYAAGSVLDDLSLGFLSNLLS